MHREPQASVTMLHKKGLRRNIGKETSPEKGERYRKNPHAVQRRRHEKLTSSESREKGIGERASKPKTRCVQGTRKSGC